MYGCFGPSESENTIRHDNLYGVKLMEQRMKDKGSGIKVEGGHRWVRFVICRG